MIKYRVFEKETGGLYECENIHFTKQIVNYSTEENQLHWSGFDEVELLQFTGMYDKNGTEIYEGDIVEAWSEGRKARGEIKRRIDGLWLIYPAWQSGMTWKLAPDNNGNTTVTIIGNIYQLKGEINGRSKAPTALPNSGTW